MPQLTIDLGLLGLPVADGDGWVQAVDSMGNPIPIAATNTGTLVFGSRALDFNTSGVATITLPSTDDLEPVGIRYLVFITRSDTVTQPVAVGPFVFTVDASLDEVAELPPADLVAAFNAVVTAAQDVLAAVGPIEPLAAQVSGYTDHGDISGAMTFTGPTGSHWFTATGPTTITLDGYSEPDVVTLICFGGAVDVTVAGMPELELVDGTAWSAQLARGVWVTGGGSGSAATPDTTPPSAITDLAAAPGEDGTTASLTFTPASDAESTARQRIRHYVQGGVAGPWPTSGALYGLTASPATLTGLIPGTTYVAEIQSYSAGGSQSVIDSVTFTTPTPAGWNVWDSIDFADATAGTFASPKDFTTDQGRTLRASSGHQIIVGSGKVKGEYQQTPVELAFPSTTPPNNMRVSAPFELVGTDSSHGPQVGMLLSLTTGAIIINAEWNWSSGNSRRLVVVPDYGTGMVYTAGPGYTLAVNQVDGIPASGTLRAETAGQVLSVYIDDDLILSVDFTNHTYGGSPNLLVGSFVRASARNNGALFGLTWEVYSS